MSAHLSRAAVGGGLLILATALAAQAQTPGTGRTTSAVDQLGLDQPPPPQPTVVGRTRELRCRGKEGIDLRVEQDPSPRQPKQVAMVLRYERPTMTRSVGQEGMGLVDYGMTNANLPGTCSWNPTGSREVPPEPGVVYFDLERDAQAWAPAGSRDTTINAAVNYPDLATLPRYLNSSEKYWVFYVDDVTGLSISYGPWPRGGAPPPATGGGGAVPTDHSLTAARGGRTSDAGTVTPPSPADGAVGTVEDATPDRPTERSTTTSVTPPPDSAAAPLPGGGKGSTSGHTSKSDDNPATEARAKRQARLASGIRDVVVAPGPRGVKLSFHAERRTRVRVQFSKEPPRWNARQGRWEYPATREGAWFASIERTVGATGYVAIPYTALEPGGRYHYLITVLADADSPERQRTGAFTARGQP
jgi:hypothetical protein